MSRSRVNRLTNEKKKELEHTCFLPTNARLPTSPPRSPMSWPFRMIFKLFLQLVTLLFLCLMLESFCSPSFFLLRLRYPLLHLMAILPRLVCLLPSTIRFLHLHLIVQLQLVLVPFVLTRLRLMAHLVRKDDILPSPDILSHYQHLYHY